MGSKLSLFSAIVCGEDGARIMYRPRMKHLSALFGGEKHRATHKAARAGVKFDLPGVSMITSSWSG